MLPSLATRAAARRSATGCRITFCSAQPAMRAGPLGSDAADLAQPGRLLPDQIELRWSPPMAPTCRSCLGPARWLLVERTPTRPTWPSRPARPPRPARVACRSARRPSQFLGRGRRARSVESPQSAVKAIALRRRHEGTQYGPRPLARARVPARCDQRASFPSGSVRHSGNGQRPTAIASRSLSAAASGAG